MRLLLIIAIITLNVIIKSDTLSVANDLKTSTEITTHLSSHEKHNNSAAQREEAFQLVVAIAKNFSAKYTAALAGQTFKSRACSPLSTFISMSILSYGAQGPTRRKLLKGLGFWGHKPHVIKQGLRMLLDHFNNFQEVELDHKLYLPYGLSPNPTFVELAQKFFHFSIRNVDLRDECQTLAKVNGWLSTGPKEHAVIGPNPTIALANSLYLRGTWKTGFNVSQISLRPFWVEGNDKIMMETMYTFGRFRYGKLRDLNATFVELPYMSRDSENGISVFIIRTNDYEGYRPITHQASEIDIRTLLNRGKKNVHVYLPKFKIEANIRSAMWVPEFFGSENPFEAPSNFSKILASPELNFGESLEKVVIEFDEKGETAKAVAGDFFQTRDERAAKEAQSIKFEVNRPFVVRIVTTGEHIIDLATIVISGNTFSRRQHHKDAHVH